MSLLMMDVITRAFVLLTLAWCAAWALRRQSAALRASVWTTALGGVLLLPALTVITPDMRVPVWRTPAPAPRAASVAPAPAVESAPEPPALPEPAPVAEPAPAADEVAPSQIAATPVAEDAAGSDVSIAQAAMFLWALGMLSLMVRLFANHLRAARLSARGIPLTPEWNDAVEHARVSLGIRRRVRVHVSDDVNVPVVTGVWRPVLHLPVEALEWNDGLRHAVAMHELAHVSRWDGLSQLVSQIACAAYWFIPVAWIGARHAAALREQASDDVVVASGMGPTTYAEHLINVARSTVGVSRPAALAMANPTHIRERIVAILDPASPRGSAGRARLVAAVVGVAAVVMLASAVELTARAADSGAVVFSVWHQQQEPSAVAPAEPPRTSTAPSAPAPAEPSPTVPATTTPTVPAPVPQATGPCDRNIKQQMSNSNGEGERRQWTIRISGTDCDIDLRMDGVIEFNRDFTDVSRISSGGIFRLESRLNGVRRELRIEPTRSGLTRVYRVDGSERAFDAQAQAWFAEFLIDLDRRTAIGVDVRVPRLLEQGGVAAVLAETAQMSSDFVRDRYYQKLAEARTLTAAETAQVLDQVAARTKSDHYAAATLSRTPARYLSEARVRDAAYKVVEAMDSDHYVASSLQTILGGRAPSAAEMDFLVKALADVTSDHYKNEVLTHMLKGTLETSHRTALAEAARQIKSDHYAETFIEAVTGTPGANRRDLAAVLRAMEGMTSDHYEGEALRATLRLRDLNDADLVTMVERTVRIESDHHQSETLRGILRHAGAGDRTRQAVRTAAAGLSRHYREEVERAVGRD